VPRLGHRPRIQPRPRVLGVTVPGAGVGTGRLGACRFGGVRRIDGGGRLVGVRLSGGRVLGGGVRSVFDRGGAVGVGGGDRVPGVGLALTAVTSAARAGGASVALQGGQSARDGGTADTGRLRDRGHGGARVGGQRVPQVAGRPGRARPAGDSGGAASSVLGARDAVSGGAVRGDVLRGPLIPHSR